MVDLVLNRKGTLLLATCTDQRIRMYEVAARSSLAEADVPTEAQVAEALANRTVRRWLSGSAQCGGVPPCSLTFTNLPSTNRS